MQKFSVANYQKQEKKFGSQKMCHVDPDDEKKKLIIVERHSEMEFFRVGQTLLLMDMTASMALFVK